MYENENKDMNEVNNEVNNEEMSDIPQGYFSSVPLEHSDTYQDAEYHEKKTWSARDIEPRKKTGLGKIIGVVFICLFLVCGVAAGVWGVNHFSGVKEPAQEPMEHEEVVKEPEISKVEDSLANQSTVVTGAVYDVSGVVEEVMPAMVSIINNYTQTVDTFFGQSYTQPGASSGSGIIIGENETEILIATNYHVVSGNDSIEITFIDGSKANAYIKGTNPQMDLAVVSVALEDLSTETKTSIAVASLGSSDELKLGQPVIAIGNALGYGQSVTTGVVSAIDRKVKTEDGSENSFIQTDAAINPGNSGGALLNIQGQVIGINSNKIGGSAIEGMGYAIPINAAEPIISDLSLQETKKRVEEAERGYLGVSIQDIPSNIAQMYGMPTGVPIAQLVEDGAADEAGMMVGDVIIEFEGFQIESYADLVEAMQYYKKGETVEVTVMRAHNGKYEEVVLQVTLQEKPE